MVKKYDFIEKTVYSIRELLEKNLPKRTTLNKMKDKRNILFKKFIEGGN